MDLSTLNSELEMLNSTLAPQTRRRPKRAGFVDGDSNDAISREELAAFIRERYKPTDTVAWPELRQI